MQEDWDLSQSFTSDGQGIRDVAVLDISGSSGEDNAALPVHHLLITGSQGGSVVQYNVPTGNLHVADFQHDHAVTAVAAVTTTTSSSLVLTGCKDAKIRIFDRTTASSSSWKLMATLEGHEKPVTSLRLLAAAGDGTTFYLCSGSWDCTAKVWKLTTTTTTSTTNLQTSLIATLPDHENSVCVTFMPNASSTVLNIATGSAGIAQNNRISGHAVRLWQVDVVTGNINRLAHVANDHEGPIRDICYNANSQALATCSNDGTVKLRSSTTAECTATLSFLPVGTPHPPMLLSVTALRDGTMIAGAEDGHVIVWSNVGAAPTILRHASCVWRVVPVPMDSNGTSSSDSANDDFLTASDDGVVRIFTRATERLAPQAERTAWAESVAAATAAQQSGPSSDEIRKLPDWNDNASRRGTSEGQVQLFRKDNIAIAAQWSMASQCWIEVGQVMGSNGGGDGGAGGGGGGGGTIDGVAYDHVLPIEVDTTGGEVAHLQIGYNTGENPFTAAQRFIDAHMLPQYHLAQIADYITQRVGSQVPTIGMDTSGSGGGGGPVATTGVPALSYEHLPSKAYLTFPLTAKTVGTLDKIKQKIIEAGILSEVQAVSLSALIDTLAATNRYHASTISDHELEVLPTILSKFPPDQAFPALDLARMTVLHPDAAKASRAAYWTGLLTAAVGMGQEAAAAAASGPAIPMLSLRLVANAFQGGPGSLQAVCGLIGPALTAAAAHASSSNKNIRLSVATVLHNVCHAMQQQKEQMQSQLPVVTAQVLPLVDNILTSRSWEEAAVGRALVATGTLVMQSAEAKAAANALFLASKVELAASPHSPVIKATATEVYRALQ